MFRTLVDALDANIVVLDERGVIIFANASWIEFGEENGSPNLDWIGVDYLQAVDQAAESGDSMAAEAAEGIRRVLSGEDESFEQIYPCHSQNEYRFYSLKVRAFVEDGRHLLAVCHTRQMNMDSLTGLPNRQLFSHGLRNELSRARRGHGPVSLMLIDADYFKQANDTYGHVFGDECLRAIAAAISRHARRPSDLAARYGGDEFVLLLGMTPVEDALHIAESIREELECMAICADGEHCITLSIGLAQIHPSCGDLREDELLIAAADAALYEAKRKGRNRVVCLSDGELAALPAQRACSVRAAGMSTTHAAPRPQPAR
ncbi:diguanylate cyclase [Uliginosibacterium sediminicola]|uniref:diguanylate cyclase n=1 Tax=Uliginosibacterium sediminicola TaxID=2024550 RepID=A0ABU9YTN1_9RHOO